MIIDVKNLVHNYKYYEKKEGLKASLKDFFRRKTLHFEALKGIDLQVPENQIIGLLGANGAGKTTMLKILSGLIMPTDGDVQILGHSPYKKKRKFKQDIAFLMGNKSQLLFHLPAIETFNLNRIIYNVSKAEYKAKIEEYTEIFGVADKLYIPVRKLSLGERMKMEFIASIIHSPKVIFLDEPTLGMDLQAQYNFRKFIETYFKMNNVTIIVTSHNMSDIEFLCHRLILLKKGEKIYDGNVTDIKNIMGNRKVVIELINKPNKSELNLLGGYNKCSDFVYEKELLTSEYSTELPKILKDLKIKDLTVESENLESVIRKVFDKSTVC